jgi:Periplasmic component of the Tol biopolymer transport system
MMKLLISLFLFCSLSASAEESNPAQEIRVQLTTNNPLTPIYVGAFQDEQSGFSSVYLSQLESVLQFDLNFNGISKLLAKSDPKEQLLHQTDPQAVFNAEKWKTFGVAWVIKTTIAQKKLSLSAFSVQTGALKTFKDIPLSGALAQDRKQLHKLADSLNTALFNKTGIANCRILYSGQTKASAEGSWSSEIWECDWDGMNARQITKENSYCVTPVMVPAQTANHANDKFIYVSYKKGQPKIFIASLREGVGQKFVDLRGNQLLPAISPKRDKIAFISDAAGRTDLFVQQIHLEKGQMGMPVQLFSYPRSTQASPTFSPDGSKVAFVSDKDGSARIYVMSSTPSEKKNPVMISKKNKESSCPSWSPDGTKLAYSAKTDGVRQIWIYDFGAGEERQLTSGSGNKENPAWAPNSLHLVFNSTDGAASELYLVNLNQPEAIKISKDPGKKHYPTWGNR